MLKNSDFNGQRLNSARLYRGLSITDLANLINENNTISKQAISQFENGRAKPSFETLILLASALGFPREFFYIDDKDKIDVKTTYFRALLSSNKKDRIMQTQKIKFVTMLYHFLEQFLEFPPLSLPDIRSGMSISEIAQKTREHWNLGTQPIQNIVYEAEKNGFIVSTFFTSTDQIDAFSQLVIINNKEYYCIVLSDNKKSAVRRQFDVAHEIGHVLLHEWASNIEELSKEEFKQREKEANEFAAEFLLPEKEFIQDLYYPTKLECYIELKRKWKVSIAAMLIRAQHLNIINYNQYQYLMRQLNYKGWRIKEPLDDILKVPQPTLLKNSVEMLINEKVFSKREFMNKLKEYGLPLNINEVETLLNLDAGFLLPEDRNEKEPIISIKSALK